MTASPASASINPCLIGGVNWLGDSVMSLPALQLFRQRHPERPLSFLVKPAMQSFWELWPGTDRIILLRPGLRGLLQTVREIRAQRFAQAFVLPHSFRSAVAPFLARIPERTGMPGHYRDALLTRVVAPDLKPGRLHQAFEYADLLLGCAGLTALPAPALVVPTPVHERARALLHTLPGMRIALLPGAARGPSKQWAPAAYARLAGLLTHELQAGVAVLGTQAEQALCEEVARAGGPLAVALAGKTSLPELAGVLAACPLAIGNDSGGLHLAAAVGCRVLGIYGITDPDRTGPLGPHVRILQNSAFRSRDVPRESEAARKCLDSITPEQVYQAARALMAS